jgi:hypothetical protein
LVPVTLQTPAPLEESTLKVTGSPEPPPVAVRLAEPPTVPETGALKVIAWGMRPMVNCSETGPPPT